MSKYLWCEDSGSGYQFWHTLCRYLYPDITVESKKNNSRLRAAVGQIEDDGNEYYILMDAAADNPDVLRENQAMRKNAAGKANVHLILIHSFEFVLLSFRLFGSMGICRAGRAAGEKTESAARRRVVCEADFVGRDRRGAFRFQGAVSRGRESQF